MVELVAHREVDARVVDAHLHRPALLDHLTVLGHGGQVVGGSQRIVLPGAPLVALVVGEPHDVVARGPVLVDVRGLGVQREGDLAAHDLEDLVEVERGGHRARRVDERLQLAVARPGGVRLAGVLRATAARSAIWPMRRRSCWSNSRRRRFSVSSSTPSTSPSWMMGAYTAASSPQ